MGMVFIATFDKISAVSWRKPEYPDKITDIPQATDKLDQIQLYQVHLAMSKIRTSNFSYDTTNNKIRLVIMFTM